MSNLLETSLLTFSYKFICICNPKNNLFCFSSTISAKSFAIQDARNSTELLWVNKTIEVNKLYQVFAIDSGVPRKGVFITLNITYSETCQKYGKVVIDENTGAVHFIAPKMKVSKYSKYQIC